MEARNSMKNKARQTGVNRLGELEGVFKCFIENNFNHASEFYTLSRVRELNKL